MEAACRVADPRRSSSTLMRVSGHRSGCVEAACRAAAHHAQKNRQRCVVAGRQYGGCTGRL